MTRRRAPEPEERPRIADAPVVEWTGNPRGPEFRAKRVALGLSIMDLIPMPTGASQGMQRIVWRQRKAMNAEDGVGVPPGGWDSWYERLNSIFEERVHTYVDLGGDPWELRLNPWSMVEIMAAVNRRK